MEEKKSVLYGYNQKADVNYRVLLSPNILYNTDSLDEGGMYISEFVNQVNASFSYEFAGDGTADIEGYYTVTAVMEGYISDEETTKTIWKREFPILPQTAFAARDNKISITRNIPVNLRQYNDFANNVIKSSFVNSQVKLAVVMDINLNAATDKGSIREKISPAIIIPLNTRFFEIQKSQTGEKPGAIEEISRVQRPVDRKLVIVYGSLLGVLLLILCYLVFFTVPVEKSPLRTHLDRIFKKHGSRMVALHGEEPAVIQNSYRVRSIDDLVKIADETGKPILFRHSDDPEDIRRFYVLDDSGTFIFDLKEMLSPSVEKSPSLNNIMINNMQKV